MKKVISNSDLDEFLKGLLMSIPHHYIEVYELLVTLYNTGLRSAEVIDLDRWECKEIGIWQVKTCKHSDIRIIGQNLINEAYEIELIERKGRYSLLDYASLNYHMKKFMRGRVFTVGDKCVYTHLFRYNHIRQLQEKGLKFYDIVAQMGHKEMKNTANYLSNKILYE